MVAGKPLAIHNLSVATLARASEEAAMGLTFVEATVTGPTGESRQLKLMVDSGAAYSLLPTKVWKALKLKPMEKLTFTLADGTDIQRNVSECLVALNGTERHSPVILGQPGDEPLLGVMTLEILGLVLDPFKRTLQPMKLRLG
jgi:clan AA aspartic protease